MLRIVLFLIAVSMCTTIDVYAAGQQCVRVDNGKEVMWYVGDLSPSDDPKIKAIVHLNKKMGKEGEELTYAFFEDYCSSDVNGNGPGTYKIEMTKGNFATAESDGHVIELQKIPENKKEIVNHFLDTKNAGKPVMYNGKHATACIQTINNSGKEIWFTGLLYTSKKTEYRGLIIMDTVLSADASKEVHEHLVQKCSDMSEPLYNAKVIKVGGYLVQLPDLDNPANKIIFEGALVRNQPWVFY